MPETHATSSPGADLHFANLPWGCRMLIDPETKWPICAEIIHAFGKQHHGEDHEYSCKCRSTEFTDKELVVQYMCQTAYLYYYQNDPETFNAWAVNELLKAEANCLGLDPGNIWDRFPDCIPRTEDLDIRNCPAGVPFRNFRQMDDGTVIIFEGKTLRPEGRTLTKLWAEEDTCEFCS